MRLVRTLGAVFALALFCAQARADIAVLLEEPYSYDGALVGAGHTAVYLTRVCAETPLKLRRCRPGELGAVLSRYHRIGGYDWIAIPLIPYLYAVERSDQIPLIADSKLEAFLREQYRREHLESVAPDTADGEPPAGDWTQLVGSSYDRTSYAFEIETSATQDDAFIRTYNARANVKSYRVVSNNCADFVRDVVNFYYPHSEHHSLWNDLGVMTPYQAAREVAKFSDKHPELESRRFVIPQVPGTVKRSRPIRGLVEVVFKSNKYEIPLLVTPPHIGLLFAGVYYWHGRFDPARGAEILDPATGDLEAPITTAQRANYERQLRTLIAADKAMRVRKPMHAWERLGNDGRYALDPAGTPALQLEISNREAEIGLSRDSILPNSNGDDVSRLILLARVRQELAARRYRSVAPSELNSDWNLLERAASSQLPRSGANTPGLAVPQR